MLTRLICLTTVVALYGCTDLSQFGAVDSNGRTASMDLSWIAPTERVNGERLFDYELYGYLVVYEHETNSTGGPEEIIIDSNTTSANIHSLRPGTYEVKVAAIDINGLHSQFSDSVFITLP